MSKILTQHLKTRQAIDFRNGFASNIEKSYWVFLGKPDAWNYTTTGTPPEVYFDTLENRNSTANNIIIAKQVFSKDTSLVIPRIDWVYGTFFDFHDEEVDLFLTDKKFYVITDDYNVYKCISNNGASASTVKPTGTTSEEQITSDGYIWKFLYKVREELYSFLTTSGGKFNSGWMPVEILPENVPTFDSRILQRSVESDAIHGQIEEVVLVESGDNYTDAIVQPRPDTTDTATGTTDSTSSNDSSTSSEEDIIQENAAIGDTTLKINLLASAKAISGFYNDYYIIYIASGEGEGQVRVIKDYYVDGTVVIEKLIKDVPAGSKYEILPRIDIVGNGTEAIVIPSVSYITKYITGFNIIDPGLNYNNATAKVYSKYATRESTIADVIIGPPGGHGKYTAWELGASNVMVIGEFEDQLKTPNGREIPLTTYYQIGLIGNLQSNNILTNEPETAVWGVEPIPPSRQIELENEYKTQTIYFNECECLGTDGIEDCLSTSDFIVGDIVKQGPDNSVTQARGVVVSWDIVEDTAPVDYDEDCGCEELGPEGNEINIGKLVVNILQSEFRPCGTTAFDIVREVWPIWEANSGTDDLCTDDGTDDMCIVGYADSTYAHKLTSIITVGRYDDNTFPIGHYILGDQSKIIGKISAWSPADSGDSGTLLITNITNTFGFIDERWIEPSFDTQGNIVAGELVHYVNKIDVATGLLDVDNDQDVSSGRITEVKTIQEYSDDLAVSGTTVINVEKTSGQFDAAKQGGSYSNGELVYQINASFSETSFDPVEDSNIIIGQGSVVGFIRNQTDLSKGVLELVNTSGEFLESDTENSYALISEIEGVDRLPTSWIEVEDVKWPEFNKKYGYNLLYIQNISGVERANNQIDTTKLVIEF